MSRILSSLLSKEKTAIRSTIDRLELASGEHEIDARLTSELIIRSKRKIRELGLDPDDTTPKELYQTLLNLVKLHDGFLAKALGSNDSSDVADNLSRIYKVTAKAAKTKTVWSMKHAVAKRLIKKMPPKVLMKKLGYRSLDSMLKRENIDDLFAGIKMAESKDWQDKFIDSFSTLSPSDFESRKMVVRQLTLKKWQKLSAAYVARERTNVIDLKEVGSVVITPMPVSTLRGITVVVLPLVLYKLNEIHLYSSYFKFQQVQHDFGKIFSASLKNKPLKKISMAGLDLNWRLILNHFGDAGEEKEKAILGPHIQPDDLSNLPIEETLYKIEPALHFWNGNNCLGLSIDNQTVSFNLMDIATDYVNGFAIDKSSLTYLHESLWDELLSRYLNQSALEEQVIYQLDGQTDEFADPSISGALLA